MRRVGARPIIIIAIYPLGVPARWFWNRTTAFVCDEAVLAVREHRARRVLVLHAAVAVVVPRRTILFYSGRYAHIAMVHPLCRVAVWLRYCTAALAAGKAVLAVRDERARRVLVLYAAVAVVVPRRAVVWRNGFFAHIAVVHPVRGSTVRLRHCTAALAAGEAVLAIRSDPACRVLVLYATAAIVVPSRAVVLVSGGKCGDDRELQSTWQ